MPVRTRAERVPPCRRGAHRAVQLAVLEAQQGPVRGAHRGYRRAPGEPGSSRGDHVVPVVARHRLGRRSGQGRPLRAVRPEPAARPVPQGVGAAAGPGARVPLLLHARGARGTPQGGARPRGASGLRRPMPAAVRRGAGTQASRGVAVRHPVRRSRPQRGGPRPDPRYGYGGRGRDRGLHHPAVERNAHLSAGGGGRRPGDAAHPHHPRRGSLPLHAAPAPDLRGARSGACR
jgi:hypothetical protein